MHTSKMVSTNPTPPVLQDERLVACIDACFDCAQTCSACADACLGEENISVLRRCIRLNEDCSDVCLTTGQMLSRQQHSERRLIRSQLETCLLACQLCGDECAQHAKHHEHCRICEEACRACVKACQEALSSLGVGLVQPARA